MLTAYALGELDTESIKEIEDACKDDPKLRRQVDEIKEAAQMVEDELKNVQGPGLTDEQVSIIEEVAATDSPQRVRNIHQLFLKIGTVAAILIIAIGLAIPTLQKSREASRDVSSGQIQSDSKKELIYAKESRRSPQASCKIKKTRPKQHATPTASEMSNAPLSAPRSGANKKTASISDIPIPMNERGIVGSIGLKDELKQAEESKPPVKKRSELGMHPDVSVPGEGRFNTENYSHIQENEFISVKDDALSTFSIDVDTASYSNVRRFLGQNTLPPAGAVRIEEMINYFNYEYAQPEDDVPFAVHTDVYSCPWNQKHRLVRIGLKGREIEKEKRLCSNLVFLLDVSGSMGSPNKLPLLKKGMKMLVDQLGENDRVSIVVYAGASGLVLPSTCCDRKETVLGALDRLRAGGSTNGGSGIKLAYNVAVENFIQGGVNRVILATDGDFNVGVTNRSDLVDLIRQKAKSGVFLSVLGFGMGNYKDDMLEKVANKGNGNYAYIDTEKEAKKVLVEQMNGTLITIAKDVKIQIEFNPAEVESFRLIGYENRVLQHQDFNDDKKDAGEIGAGHTVTALYEVVPAGNKTSAPRVDKLKYQVKPELTKKASSGEMMTVKLRYKLPDASKSTRLEFPLRDMEKEFKDAGDDFKFAAAVAGFGMLLRGSTYAGDAEFSNILEWAQQGAGSDKSGYRSEFLTLVRKAMVLKQ